MVQVVLIGLAAGLAAALLFGSLVSGSLFSFVLFYLAPVPVMIAGLGWTGLAAFCLLGALSTDNDEPQRASRPFDATRNGFVLGEGAGFLVLEDWGRGSTEV